MSAGLAVYNALGIKVLEMQLVTLVPGENTIEFSVAELPTGTYFIHVRKDNEVLDVSRISVVN